MKRKVKKIPKYSLGADMVSALKGGEISASSKKLQGIGGMANQGAIGGQMIGSALGIEQGKAAQIANGVASMVESVPVIGGMLAAPIRLWGGLAGGDGVVNKTTGEVEKKSSGLTRWLGLGRSDESLYAEADRIKTSINNKEITEDLKMQYANDVANSFNQNVFATAAEGGIMRRPVEALVSKGELIYNPVTKKLSQVPGSNGKPNKADDVYTRLYEGDVVVSNSPTMIMPNGKTPAQNLMGMVDKYSTGGTVKAREAIIKKVVNWQEANKTKPQEYAKFYEGVKGVNKYGYNINMSDFAYWDKDKNDYTDEYKNWVKNLTEQDVRDIEAGKYGDMSTYFGKNPGKKLDVATAQQLMTDKKYGDWHKIGQAIVDNKIKTKGPALDDVPRMAKQINIFPGMKERVVHHVAGDGNNKAELTHLYTQGLEIPKLKKVPDPYIAEVSKRIRQKERKQRFNDWLTNTGNTLRDWAPLATALFGDYDYHTEQEQISPAEYIPTGVSTEPIRRAANESYAMARYNQANINPNTGAGMAYGLQAASNRAKTLADAYTWQQDAQNKLIAQNVGIYNDWAKRYDAAKYQAIADTRANEGAAQQMRDSAIRDAYEYVAGRRNDRMRLAMMKPLAKYAFDDDTYKNIYSRAIV